MVSVRTIKDVDDRTWNELKSLASKNDLGMGKMLQKVVQSYSEKDKVFWNKILSGRKVLSDDEASDILRTVKNLRKEKGFRNDTSF